VDLQVDRAASSPSLLPVRRPAIDAESTNRDGAVGIFDLMLWADDGWLEGVELVTYGEESTPAELPDPSWFDPSHYTAT
jgi:hypothetical protein